MKKFLAGAFAATAALIGRVAWTGTLSFDWPWRPLPEFGDVEVTLLLPDAARIVSIEPIALDCRARVYAEVPIEGRREHSILDRVYRTDTVTMTAIGDVDTCVEGSSAQVVHRRDGSTEVIVLGSSIIFVRPRVDTVATAASVEVSKGLAGKLTDVFPWVSDDVGLTPLAFAHAQNVIGGSVCMQKAYAVTENMLVQAYRQQFIDQGADPQKLTVRIEGQPLFPEPAPLDLGEGVEMTAGTDEVVCLLADDLERLGEPER
ncbi:MAG: hypothetical protein O3C27_00560 [Actinomycetota bacterium]|nr:hypothetical protein [Actinomycetota bacterium]